METQTAKPSAPPARSRPAASFLRTSAGAAGMLLFSSFTPWCVAEAQSAVDDAARGTSQLRAVTDDAAQGVPQTANVLQLPDDATTPEVQGEYGVGIAILLIGVLLTSALLYGLFVVLLKRTWGEHDHAHVGGRPPR